MKPTHLHRLVTAGHMESSHGDDYLLISLFYFSHLVMGKQQLRRMLMFLPMTMDGIHVGWCFAYNNAFNLINCET